MLSSPFFDLVREEKRLFPNLTGEFDDTSSEEESDEDETPPIKDKQQGVVAQERRGRLASFLMAGLDSAAADGRVTDKEYADTALIAKAMHGDKSLDDAMSKLAGVPAAIEQRRQEEDQAREQARAKRQRA